MSRTSYATYFFSRGLAAGVAVCALAACTGTKGLSPQVLDARTEPGPDATMPMDAAAPDTTTNTPMDASGPDASAPDGAVIEVPTLATPAAAELGAFVTSDTCAQCHSNAPGASAMRDELDRDIAPYDLWQSSMMANAARDPLFRAVVSAEIAAIPSAQEEIETTCLGCHAPMAVRSDPNFSLATLYDNQTASQVGLDGVSCTVCHQITPDGLGEPSSFSGRFTINEQREIYGPHDNLFSMPMVMRANYRPTMANHVTDSALCGSCHTLFTEALDDDGQPVGATLPEQTPFLEWRNSSFPAAGKTCQGCHMPTTSEASVAIRTGIARSPGGSDFGRVQARNPYGRHTLVGGNTLVPAIIRDNAAELSPRATRAAFDATIAGARAQLASAAELTANANRSGDAIYVAVNIVNKTGHKLPTAHPIRRMWLRVEVRDASDQLVFLSGGYDEYNRLLGADGSPLPFDVAGGPLNPHVNRTADPDQPAVFESLMVDAEGRPTSTLLKGARYGKDNRILPAGWVSTGPDAATTAPVGTGGDADFVGGADTVTYEVSAPAAQGPYQILVRLLYTPLSARWYADLVEYDTPEVRAFVRYYEAADRRPETIAAATAQVP